MVIANIHFHLVLQLFKGRFFFQNRKEEMSLFFKTPSDNRTDYIKRLIGIPGDTITIY